MKKIVFTLAALAAFTISNAQEAETTGGGFSNGDVFLSGSVGFGTTKTGDVSADQFNIAPRVGFFVSENIAVGAELGYTSATANVSMTDEFGDEFSVESKTNAIAIGAFGRYYFTPSSKFSVFGQLSAAYASATTELEMAGSAEVKMNGFNFGVAPGISYFVSDNFAIEANVGVLGYSTMKPDFEGAESTDTFEFGINLNDINFGVVYKF